MSERGRSLKRESSRLMVVGGRRVVETGRGKDSVLPSHREGSDSETYTTGARSPGKGPEKDRLWTTVKL